MERLPRFISRSMARVIGSAIPLAFFLAGTIVRSEPLLAIGLPTVGRRAFRRGDLEAAEARALQLLRIAERSPQDWNHGNALHHAHSLLGRIALARGQTAVAETELLESANVAGSPQLKSFGPNMQLALDLLNAGRRDAVLEYLRLCGKFWEMGQASLRRWATDVESGRVPEFGGNLLY
jgi:hypothetical protein